MNPPDSIHFRDATDSAHGYEQRPYGYSYASTPFDICDAVAPLVEKLKSYDKLRVALATQGGQISDLQRVTNLLKDPITLKGHFRSEKVALTDANELRRALGNLGIVGLKLQVRMLPYGMPVYYLCRPQRDSWSEYSLVVEDLYMSPGYPLLDVRFAKLMHWGHESYFIRLSPFRTQALSMLRGKFSASEKDVDDLLYQLGRHIFQAAWHEDQRPGILTAECLGLTNFRRAVELLYLCLSGELCELRSNISVDMEDFFVQIYRQPAIHTFLRRLRHLEGSEIDKVPQKALRLFSNLSRHFGKFFALEVPWGETSNQVPLYKLIFSNLSRLELIKEMLADNDAVCEGREKLEAVAESTLAEINEGN